MKIDSYYREAWQESTNGITYGPSFTYLPVNWVYPFYPIDADPFAAQPRRADETEGELGP